jgi:hypothetical protein
MVVGTWRGSGGTLFTDGLLQKDLVDKLKAKSATQVSRNVRGEGRQGADHRPRM